MEASDLDSLEHSLRAMGVLDRAGLASVSNSEPAQLLREAIIAQPYVQRRRPGDLGEGRRHRKARGAAFLAAAILIGGLGFIASATDRWLEPARQPDSIDGLIKDIPLPPGGTWDRQRDAIASQHALIEEPGLSSALAFGAACQWYGYWLEGKLGGNDAQTADALATIDQIPDWPQFAGEEARAMARQFTRLRVSALAGDTTQISDWLNVNCSSEIYGRG